MTLLEIKNQKRVSEAIQKHSEYGIVDRINLLQIIAEIFQIKLKPPSKRQRSKDRRQKMMQGLVEKLSDYIAAYLFSYADMKFIKRDWMLQVNSKHLQSFLELLLSSKYHLT